MFQTWACEKNYLLSYLDTVLNSEITSDVINAFLSNCNVDDERSGILSIDGTEARIKIRGFLSEKSLPPIAKFFGIGGTSYQDITNALAEASGNSDVDKIVLDMSTPGGEVSGVDNVWSAVRAASKSKIVTAENHGMIASAGYWIASAADEIVAKSPVVETGSVGVIATQINYDKARENAGIRVVNVISRNAPNKQPDGTQEEGLKVLQERVDAIERVFISRIAEGRGISSGEVEKNFGKGSLMIADDPNLLKPNALSVGMIDRVDNCLTQVAELANNSLKAAVEKAIADGTLKITAGATSPFKNYPVVDKPWDADAAIGRVRSKTGSAEKPSASYKNAFFWYDTAAEDKFGSYKLPFVDVVDGKLVAIRRGVFAANGAMKGARGGVQIPAADKGKVQSHIDKYIKKIEKEDARKKPASAGQIEKGKVITMDPKELLAQDQALAAYVQELVSAAEKNGTEKIQARIKKALPFIRSNDYPAVRELACKVLEGETDFAALDGAVTVLDSLKASKSTELAIEETEAAGETVAKATSSGISADGTINTEDEYQAEIAAQRAALNLS